MVAAVSGPPVIDAEGWFAAGNCGEPSQHLVQQLRHACTTWGFFQLVNTGLPREQMDRAFAAARAFFSLPLEEKRKIKRGPDNARGFFDDELTKQRTDLKQCFDFGYVPRPDLPDDHPDNVSEIEGWNQWPQGQAQFRREMGVWYDECTRLSFKLLEAFALGMGLPPDALHHLFQDGGGHTAFMRLNYYPPQPDEVRGVQYGVHHHTDAGFLTILLQDEVPGLEVQRGSEWVLVRPIRHALTINVGDMAQVLSNDTFLAPVHRVLPSAHDAPRYSIPFFFNPSMRADIQPLPAFLEGGSKSAAYSPVNWGEFRLRRFQGDYADLGEEVQISQYRV